MPTLTAETTATTAADSITTDPAATPVIGSVVALDLWRPEGQDPQLGIVVGLNPLMVSRLAPAAAYELDIQVIS